MTISRNRDSSHLYILAFLLIGLRVSAESVIIINSVVGKGTLLGVGTYEIDAIVQLRAVAQVDWKFDHWENIAEELATNNPLSFRATKESQPRAVMIQAPGTGRFPGGTISWGDNSQQQTNVPTDLSGVTALAGGRTHSIALKQDGTVVSWGKWNSFYGNERLGPAYIDANFPVGLNEVVAIAAGSDHSAALKSDGQVVVAGFSYSGGNSAFGVMIPAIVPDEVNNVIAISAGGYSTAAVKQDGTVVVWGASYCGSSLISVPSGSSRLEGGTVVSWGLTEIKAIAVGWNHILALKRDGTVIAWGNNTKGQTNVPSGLSGVIEVAAGSKHSLALKQDGTVVAWGDNLNAAPAGLNEVKAIATKQDLNLALRRDGTVVQWGDGFPGQSPLPQNLRKVSAIAVGFAHTLIQSDGLGLFKSDPEIIQKEVGQPLRLEHSVRVSKMYQWFLQGEPFLGATEAAFEVPSIDFSFAGKYQVAAINEPEALLTPATEVRVVPVGFPRIVVNGSEVLTGATDSTNRAQVELRTSFPNGQIFYTLDGSTPTFLSAVYTTPLILTNTSTLKTFSISADFTQQVNGVPVFIEVLPTFSLARMVIGQGVIKSSPLARPYMRDEIVSLTAVPVLNWRFVRWSGDVLGTNLTVSVIMSSNRSVQAEFEEIPRRMISVVTPGGGSVNGSGQYFEGAEVSISATPSTGWEFLRWQGEVLQLSTEANNRVTADRAKTVQALFGTRVSTTSTGNGTARKQPELDFYPYGSHVLLVGDPMDGNFLKRWGNAASSGFNPILLHVTNANPVVSAWFNQLGADQVLLTVKIVGSGSVTGNPSRTDFIVGESIVLTGFPEPGYTFGRWSEDVDGDPRHSTSIITMNSSRTVTAEFVVGGAPRLAMVPDQNMMEETTLRITLSGNDPDQSAETLNYVLLEGPEGMTVVPGGTLHWIPTEAQGPGSFSVTVGVTDLSGLIGRQSFTVNVSESNLRPKLLEIPSHNISEGQDLAIQLSVTDLDIPNQNLHILLDGAPSGLVIGNDRVLRWTPTEVDGPSTRSVTVRVNDGLIDTEQSFQLTVSEVNSPPVIELVATQRVEERKSFALQLNVADYDLPKNSLTLNLISGPAGMTLDQTGLISWTTDESHGGGVYPVVVRVADNGQPMLVAEQTFDVVVEKVNNPGVFTTVSPQVVIEGMELKLSSAATDLDIPQQTLVYSVTQPPRGVVIDPITGLVRWIPDEVQGSGIYHLQIIAVDNGEPPLVVTNEVTIHVLEANSPPELHAVFDQIVAPGINLTIPLEGMDVDVPANTLTYRLVNGPNGAMVIGNEFRWTPIEAQGERTEVIEVEVSDNGEPALASRRQFRLTLQATAPFITLRSPGTGTTNDERFSLLGSAVDNVGVESLRWIWNGQDHGELSLQEGEFRMEGLLLLPGANRFVIVARDAAGNTTELIREITWAPLRTLAVQDAVQVQEGQRISFPVTFASVDDVSGLSFRIFYDTTYLADPELEWASVAAQGLRNVNTTIVGTINASMALAGTPLPQGTSVLAMVNFRARSVPSRLNAIVRTQTLSVSGPAGTFYPAGTVSQEGSGQISQRLIKGDNNANQRIDIGDAEVISQLQLGLEELRSWDVELNDLNQSSGIDSGDVVKALRIVVGLDAQPTLQRTADLHGPNQESVNTNDLVVLSLPDGPVATISQPYRVVVKVTRLGRSITGLSFRLNHPASLTLVDFQVGPLIPADAIHALNTTAGSVNFAAVRSGLWPNDQGDAATIIFMPQASFGERVEWPVQLNGVEVASNGFELRSLDSTSSLVRSRPGQIKLGLSLPNPEGPWNIEILTDVSGELVVETSMNLIEWTEVVRVMAPGPENPTRVSLQKAPTAWTRFWRVRQF